MFENSVMKMDGTETLKTGAHSTVIFIEEYCKKLNESVNMDVAF